MYQNNSNAKRGAKPTCDEKCWLKIKSGENAYNFSGGRKYKRGKEKGHILIYKPDHPNARKKYVLEHRLIVEKQIGRYLEDNESVHHINMLKDDNRIENLILCENNIEHHLMHGSLNKCVEKLIESGYLIFDKNKKVYKIKQQ